MQEKYGKRGTVVPLFQLNLLDYTFLIIEGHCIL